jgi:methylamine--corrinoid protein Co-methyltransferase
VISLLEVADRARKGPKMDEKEWNMSLFRKMQELIHDYDIKHPEGDEGSFLNVDDELADRAFNAAVDFLIDRGVYCITSGRIIHFSEDEVREAIKEAPREIVIGEGRDARKFKQRKVEGNELVNIVPGHHAPFTEDLAPLVVKNFAQIPRADFIEGFNFPTIEGREIYSMPMEAYASRREAAWMREGVEKAGRPGMSIVLYPLSTKASTLISAIDPERGLRRTDGVLLTVLPDIKVEYDLLTAAMVFNDYGFFGVNGGFGIVGGFCLHNRGKSGSKAHKLGKVRRVPGPEQEHLHHMHGVEHHMFRTLHRDGPTGIRHKEYRGTGQRRQPIRAKSQPPKAERRANTSRSGVHGRGLRCHSKSRSEQGRGGRNPG